MQIELLVWQIFRSRHILKEKYIELKYFLNLMIVVINFFLALELFNLDA